MLHSSAHPFFCSIIIENDETDGGDSKTVVNILHDSFEIMRCIQEYHLDGVQAENAPVMVGGVKPDIQDVVSIIVVVPVCLQELRNGIKCDHSLEEMTENSSCIPKIGAHLQHGQILGDACNKSYQVLPKGIRARPFVLCFVRQGI